MKAAIISAFFLLGATSAIAGSAHPAPLAAEDIAEPLGLAAEAFEFRFDEPVHGKITFELRDPSYPEPKIHSVTSLASGKIMRVAYCFVRPQRVAGNLGLSVGGQPNSSYHFSVSSIDPASKTGLSFEYADPFGTPSTFLGVGLLPDEVGLDADVIVYAQAGPMPAPDAARPKTAEEYMTYERCIVIKVRFSKKPFH